MIINLNEEYINNFIEKEMWEKISFSSTNPKILSLLKEVFTDLKKEKNKDYIEYEKNLRNYILKISEILNKNKKDNVTKRDFMVMFFNMENTLLNDSITLREKLDLITAIEPSLNCLDKDGNLIKEFSESALLKNRKSTYNNLNEIVVTNLKRKIIHSELSIDNNQMTKEFNILRNYFKNLSYISKKIDVFKCNIIKYVLNKEDCFNENLNILLENPNIDLEKNNKDGYNYIFDKNFDLELLTRKVIKDNNLETSCLFLDFLFRIEANNIITTSHNNTLNEIFVKYIMKKPKEEYEEIKNSLHYLLKTSARFEVQKIIEREEKLILKNKKINDFLNGEVETEQYVKEKSDHIVFKVSFGKILKIVGGDELRTMGFEFNKELIKSFPKMDLFIVDKSIGEGLNENDLMKAFGKTLKAIDDVEISPSSKEVYPMLVSAIREINLNKLLKNTEGQVKTKPKL